MKAIDYVHEGYVHGRRVRVLSKAMVELIPPGARVLDVGCGDGLVSSLIQLERPDISIEGIDVLVRGKTHIPVTHFDGQNLPYADNSFDVVMFIDVLHHTTDPTVLLGEAARVAKDCVLIKDHTKNGLLAGPTLWFMDTVGNARHGVALPCNYWPKKRWYEAFRNLNLEISYWTNKVALYPWWAMWLFGRSLHCIVRLNKQYT
ncbi:MAG: class I SAM-dependent methyltransferase [Thainema sp.]